MFNLKLFAIRLALLAATGTAAIIKKNTSMGYASLWLHYYLTGKGGNLQVPAELVSNILPTILWAYERNSEERMETLKTYQVNFHSTTYYEGRGFEGRPPLFYMIGCFTARVKQLNETKYSLYIKDVYDWHPNVIFKVEGDGWIYNQYEDWMEEESWTREEKWFTSGFSFISARWNTLLNKLLGDEYYPLKGWPMDQAGISNQLWFDLMKVGAKPFTSIAKGVFELPYDEIDIS